MAQSTKSEKAKKSRKSGRSSSKDARRRGGSAPTQGGGQGRPEQSGVGPAQVDGQTADVKPSRRNRRRRREVAARQQARAENPKWKPGDSRQLLARYDVDRPHIRLGFGWVLAVIAALALGPIATAVVFGMTAGIAALQTAIAWQRSGTNPNRVVAGVVAAAIPVATGAAEWGLGAALLIGVALSVFTSGGSSAAVIRDGATTIRCWLFVGLAAASVVAAYHFSVWAGVSLVVLAAAYDSGDYIFGADARRRWVGLVAGSCAVAVVAFSLWVIQIAPFGGDPVFVFAAAMILTAPLGQVVASLVLPDGRALASGLRRLDTLIVAGPVWVLLLWYYPL